MVSWAALLDEAVKKPGFIHEAYIRFHNYSLGNQLLVLYQCFERALPLGPLASYRKWKELGRHVKKGEKALTLCMPLACKRTKTVRKEDGTEQEEQFTYTHFALKNHWFVLGQTEGAEYQAPPIPEWDEQKALQTLGFERLPFEDLEGNTQGYARRGGKIAINPLAALPHKTLFHELAHCLLHCQETDLTDTDQTPRSIAEVEAEAVSLLCCESLELPGTEFSRGYIQSWGNGQAISERSAQRIFHAADQILRAGQPTASPSHEDEAQIKKPLCLRDTVRTSTVSPPFSMPSNSARERRVRPRSCLTTLQQIQTGVDMHIPHNERGIQPGPLATFPKWKELSRHVKKGAKALTLCLPLTCKRKRTVTKEDGADQEEEFVFTHFTYKANCYHELIRN